MVDLKTILARVESLPIPPAEKRAISRALTKHYKTTVAASAAYRDAIVALRVSVSLHAEIDRGGPMLEPMSPTDLHFALTQSKKSWKFVTADAMQNAIKADLRRRIKEHLARVEDFKKQLQIMEQSK